MVWQSLPVSCKVDAACHVIKKLQGVDSVATRMSEVLNAMLVDILGSLHKCLVIIYYQKGSHQNLDQERFI